MTMSAHVNRILWTALLLCGIAMSAPKQGVELVVAEAGSSTNCTECGHTIDESDRRVHRGGVQEEGTAARRPGRQVHSLRRVYLDLIGIPPSPAEQDAFLKDESPDAYEKVVDKLLANEQHGVRYARHWLDVLRYADADERMTAAAGIHLLARLGDLRAQQRHAVRPVRAHAVDRLPHHRAHADGGRRRPLQIEPRPDDMFALGFLARGDVVRDGKNTQEMPIMAVETVSTAFMGMTVGCAKCHDHMYDPISQRDFYAMKALFDPLVIKKVTLANPAEIMAQSKALDEAQKKRAAAQAPLERWWRRLQAEAVRRPRGDAAGRRAGDHPQAGEGTHRRGAEDRRRLFPGAAHRRRQDPGGHASRRPEEVQGAAGAAQPGAAAAAEAAAAARCRRSGPWRWTAAGSWRRATS